MANDNIDVSDTSNVSEMDALDSLWGDGNDAADESTGSGDDATEDGAESGDQSGDESESGTEDDGSAESDAETADADAKPGAKSKSAKDATKSDDDAESNGSDVEYPSVSFKAVQKKYPEIFKEFPGLKGTLVREQKFTELFPTHEDAIAAQAKAATFEHFEADIMSGSPERLLEGLAQGARPVFDKFSGRFLETLQKVDKQQYNRVIAPLIKQTIQYVFARGVKENSDDLKNSASYFSKIFFDSDPENIKVEAPYKADDPNKRDPEREQFERERRDFQNTRYNTALVSVNDSTVEVLKAEIAKQIDPNEENSDFFNSALTDRVMNEVYKTLNQNPRFMAGIRKMWERAESAGYSREWMNKIAHAWLSSARAVAPSIRSKVSAEAKKKKSPNGNNGTKQVTTTTNRNPIPAGRAPQARQFTKAPASGTVDYGRTSDMDLMNGKVTLKGK